VAFSWNAQIAVCKSELEERIGQIIFQAFALNPSYTLADRDYMSHQVNQKELESKDDIQRILKPDQQ
jgi:hypothetical protein